MRNKLLYFLITIFGVATLISGYIWTTDDRQQTTSSPMTSQQIHVNDKIKDEQKETRSDTGYRLQVDENTKSIDTIVEPPDTPTTTETISKETFKTKVILQINGKNLLVPYQENITAEGAMREAQSRYPDKFWYESIEYGGDLGTFVKSINGIAENNREKMYWILYINGKKSNKGISTLILKPDDIIMWNYEKEIL